MTSRTARTLTAAVLAALPLAGCSWSGATDPERPGKPAQSGPGQPLVLAPAASLTPAGVVLAELAGVAERAPTYDVTSTVDPATGAVEGLVLARLPVGTEAAGLNLRYLAGLEDLDADAGVGAVEVDGEDVEAVPDGSIIAVPLPPGHADVVSVSVPFSYTLPRTEPAGLLGQLAGISGPADVGLLGRRDDAANLGHWFPLWVPEGNDADPEPSGFGDIGNFPAAIIRLELTVPDGWTVVDGGVRTSEERGADGVTVTSEGYGMNDLAVNVLHGYVSESRVLGGDLADVRLTAYGPEDAEAELAGVLDEAAASVRTLSDRFVGYPWRELDVVSAPLGAGVGGMEWPGAAWIESDLFAGGIPGLTGLEELGDLGGLLGDPGASEGDLGLMLETLRPWTIAHEVGHQWWHVLVGNDSVRDPAVDEPLAQHAACLVMRQHRRGDGDDVCRAHILGGFDQMRLLGGRDGPAARPTDDFDSAVQYGGLVYGKAAALYLALEDRFGRERVAAALGEVVKEGAFAMLETEDLRQLLGESLGRSRELDRLWSRWMHGRRGAQDVAAVRRGL